MSTPDLQEAVDALTKLGVDGDADERLVAAKSKLAAADKIQKDAVAKAKKAKKPPPDIVVPEVPPHADDVQELAKGIDAAIAGANAKLRESRAIIALDKASDPSLLGAPSASAL